VPTCRIYTVESNKRWYGFTIATAERGDSNRHFGMVRISTMTDSASSHAVRWPAVDRHLAAAFGIDQIAWEPRIAERSNGGPVACPRWEPAPATTLTSLPPRSRRIGRFEQMAMGSHLLSPMRSRILGVLLDAANPSCCGGNAILRPLWVNESMHRAYQMVRLTRMLDGRARCSAQSPAAADLEWRIAKALAGTQLSLRIARDTEKLPCSQALRDVVRDLVELFGETTGICGISTSVERLELPSFKRRALVLMAVHLVIEILLFAGRTRHGGRALVMLDRPGPELGRLAIGYDDDIVPFGPLNGSHGVIDDLASLLESDITYRADGGRIVAGVEFPLR
jgi:hypothetical protein